MTKERMKEDEDAIWKLLYELEAALNQRLIQVLPIWIHRVNEPHLPGARPMLDRLLARNSVADIIEAFIVDEHFQAVAFGKSCDESLAMLERATR